MKEAAVSASFLVTDDLPNVTYTIRHGHATATFYGDLVHYGIIFIGLSIEEAERLTDQIFAYFRMKAAEPKSKHSPSQLVDLLWHYAQKHRDYPSFCQSLTGHDIIHNEAGSDVIGDPVTAVAATVECMRRHGIPVKDEYWRATPEDEISCTASAP